MPAVVIWLGVVAGERSWRSCALTLNNCRDDAALRMTRCAGATVRRTNAASAQRPGPSLRPSMADLPNGTSGRSCDLPRRHRTHEIAYCGTDCGG
jgi:hypothetical protein